jgi:hypothetical protein
MNNGTIVIIQQRMAGWLMLNGMCLLETKTDKKDSNRKIFIFKDSKKLRTLMSRYNEAKEMIVAM